MDDDIPTDEDKYLWDSKIESKDDDDMDPDLGDEAYGPDIGDYMD